MKKPIGGRYGWRAGDQADFDQHMVIQLVLDLHRNGWSNSAIARELDARGVPTARGGAWRGNLIANIIAANRE